MALKGKNKAGQLRALFARGVLRSKGKGKDRKTQYNKKANATDARNSGRARKLKGLSGGKSNAGNPFGGRAVIGGSKATGLRSGMGGNPGKGRAERVAAGKAVLDRARVGVTDKDRRVSGYLHAVKYKQPGQSVRDAARGETTRRKQFEIRAKREARIEKAQRASDVNPKVQSFRGLEEKLGRDGAIKATRERSARIAAGREVGRAALEKRRAAYNPLFGAQTKPDYSATRAQRIAAGREVLKPFGMANPNGKVKQGQANRRALIGTNRAIVTRIKLGQAASNARTQQLSTRAGRIAAGNRRAQEFLGSSRGREAVRLNNRAADHLERRGMKDPGARDINKMRVKQQRADKTLANVLKSQRFTYNGWTGGKRDQGKRYARLKNLERRLRDSYGL